eukprot:scaffold52168_cov75-Phaeocystis_antarctica.AAC.2
MYPTGALSTECQDPPRSTVKKPPRAGPRRETRDARGRVPRACARARKPAHATARARGAVSKCSLRAVAR